MVNIQEIIGKVCPEAVFEENEVALAVVPDAKWHTVAETLKKAGYDWLACVVGEDWGDALGCTYYIKSTSDYSMVSVKVTTTDRENPMLHSVYDVWEIARLEEREVYDFYGIKFINHPDMRRLYLRNDWVGFPLRKDYDENPEINPIRLYHEKTDDTTVTYVEDAEGNVTEKTATIFSPEEFVVNIGPQHPATHGVLRFRTSLDGEEVKKIDLYCGYIHRGVEKALRKTHISADHPLLRPYGLLLGASQRALRLRLHREGPRHRGAPPRASDSRDGRRVVAYRQPPVVLRNLLYGPWRHNRAVLRYA